ncbi:MAG: MtrB/PioB family outer membrane beta-barrel protein [Acidobacteriota bacterium]
MRTRLMIVMAALLLASATLAVGQAAAQEQTSASAPAQTGVFEIGFRGGSVTGDEARFERYRDLRNGANINLNFTKQTDGYWFNAEASNAGYRDQRYAVGYKSDTLTFSAFWDSIPLNYGYNTLTPWTGVGTAKLTLDTAARTAVQNGQALGVPYLATQLGTASIYRGLAQRFDLEHRRDTLGVGFGYSVNRELALDIAFQSVAKAGTQPWGASYAFRNANEVPLPIDHRTNELSVAAEWANQKGMFRAAWEYSAFSNAFDAFEWDNPSRVTDFSNGRTPPLGPYDPSGYSNGNGPAFGRQSVFPDSTSNTVSFLGMVKLPRRTVVNGGFSVTDMSQNDTLIPWSSNAVINQPLVWAAFPELAALERSTAEAKVRGMNGQVNLSSRPTSTVGLNLKYRHNNHSNFTRPFNATEYVRFDAVPEETGSENHPYSIARDTFDATASFNLVGMTTLRVGYGYDSFNRTSRAHNDMTDNIFRVTLDTMGNQRLTLRAGYEYNKRKGDGFSVHAVEEGGGQPGLRYYDEADRNRSRFSLLATLLASDTADITAQVAYGQDKYQGPGLEFGLRDAKTVTYNLGFNLYPMDTVIVGVNYGRDTFNSMQKSRNANPAPDPSWTDPNRDWYLDNDETVNNVDIFVDVLKAIQKTDLRFAYSFSDSDNAFLHSGPRIDTLRAIGQSEALPNVTNRWQQARIDLRIYATDRVGVGVEYWYEKLDITDFATVNLDGTNQPRIDYLGGLTTGYGNRPYKGNTFFVRLIVTPF